MSDADLIREALQLALDDCDPENDFSPGQVFVDALAALARLDGGADASALRRVVGLWLRTRQAHLDDSYGFADNIVPKEMQARMFQQLAADADHSDLLYRLFSGGGVLPFAEWKARGGAPVAAERAAPGADEYDVLMNAATGKLAEVLARAEAAERERDEARALLADPQRMLDTIRVYGEPFRDLVDIQRALNEWRAIGGRPSWLDVSRSERELRASVGRLEEALRAARTFVDNYYRDAMAHDDDRAGEAAEEVLVVIDAALPPQADA